MPRPRTPLAKAEVDGRQLKDPQRYRERKEPVVKDGVGLPPTWMTKEQKQVWLSFTSELPWLNVSHRGLLEVAVPIRAKIWGGQEVTVGALNLLRMCLGQMGATPADATKVVMPDDGKEDPDEAFFSRPN